jgi:hypothetical protein
LGLSDWCLAGHLFRETSWALTIETGVDKLAHAIGLERSAMIGVAAPYVLALGAAYAVAFVAYRLGTHERAQKPDFDILFDPKDPRFVKQDENETTRFFIGLRILRRECVLYPNVRARESEFTTSVLSSFGRLEPSGSVQLYAGGALDHEDIELIELVRLPSYGFLNIRGPDDPIGHIQRFVLEARGRNATTFRAEFEYDPLKIPMIRKIEV